MARIIATNLCDSSTITATSEATGYDADNLIDADFGNTWRSTGVTAQNLNFDMGAAVTVTGAALWGHNLTSSATVSLQADDDSGYASLNVNESMTVCTGLPSEGFAHNFAYHYIAPASYRYWRIAIADATNPDGYFEAAYAIIGAYFTYPIANGGYSHQFVDPSEQFRSRAGMVRTYNRQRYRTATAQSRWMTDDETNGLVDIGRLNGVRTMLLFSAFPGEGGDKERDHTILGMLSSFGAQSYQTFSGGSTRTQSSITVNENV